MKGNVEAISQKNKAVNIDGTWYDLASNVKLDYVKKGACEFQFQETEYGNPVITFIKSVKEEKNEGKEIEKAIVDSNINRAVALKCACQLFMGQGKEAISEIEEISELFHEYLNKGLWIHKVKEKEE